ncbi:uncharacterized protein LOC144907786 [Branchiostoma floridae x Branchiostoma belcheri]
MEDEPTRTEQTVTTRVRSGLQPAIDNRDVVMRTCSCGWKKATTFRGLRIHQGRTNCQGKRQHDRTASAGQTEEDMGQVYTHRTQGLTSEAQSHASVSTPSVAEHLVREQPVAEPTVESVTLQEEIAGAAPHRQEEPAPERRERIKWPKANSREEWEKLDDDLCQILDQGLKGDVEMKLNRFGDLVYSYCSERYGTYKKQAKEVAEKQSNRREREIAVLIRRRRQLRKRWRKASQEEKAGLEVLWKEVRGKLESLRRAERLRRKRKRKAKERNQFFKNPYKFARNLLEEKKGGSLQISKEELELHLQETYSDPQRNAELGSPGYVPRPTEPEVAFDVSPPKLSEVETAIRKARSAAAPGPNGVSYKLYKMCPKIRRLLWRLFRVAWKKGCIPRAWRRAGGVFIPKEKESTNIKQFRNISLLNVEGKLFFSILAKRMIAYLLANSYIDTEVQKAGVPGFPGCIEHASTIWQQIQLARRNKEDLHIVWLDLTNAYGSVPHSVIHYALNFFWIPTTVRIMIQNYFQDFRICVATNQFTTEWQQLEKGIAMGCTISPLLFVLGFEIFLIGARQVAGGIKLPSGQRLPPLRAFMDDVTSILRTAPCTRRVLLRLEELTRWARMSFKPSKSRSLSLRKGKVSNQVFSVSNQNIPTIQQEPVKSLGRLYTSDIDDAKRSQELRKQAVEGLEAIDRCELPGKLKVWCLQSVLLPRLKWPMKMYEIPLTTADQIEAKTNSFIRKWLGVPRCLSRIALAGRNMLTLPINSVTEEYKLDKVRMTLELMWSKDNAVKAAYRRQKTGRKWNPEEVINQAISRLKHRDIVGAVQRGRTGLGWGERTQRWERATQTERKQLVVEEVKRMEEEGRKVCAVSQKQQGAWVNWEDCLDRKLTWNDVWKIPDCRLSFLIRAVYDVLPCPRNLSRWYSREEACQLCGTPKANLKHTLSACTTSLQQGRFTWRHNKALRVLAAALEVRRRKAGSREETQKQTFIPFVKEGQRATQGVRRSCEGLMRKGEWEMAVDLDKRLVFPRNICETTLRPDIVLWSSVQKTVLVIELTIPWEENIQAAYERKKLKYQELVQQCAENGWRSLLYPVEVGCRGFVGTSLTRLCRDLSIGQKQLVKQMAEEVERCSFWLWLRRKDCHWKTKE